MSAPNIEEIKKLRDNLERDIFRLIYNFEQTTSTCVIDIDIERFIYESICGNEVDTISSLCVDVRL